MSLQEAASQFNLWRSRPDIFVEQVLGVIPDAWQREVLQAFPHNQRIAMKACRGPGKTAVLSWIAWNFLLTRNQPKIAATSITGANLSDNLWSEMSLWQQKSPLLRDSFTWTRTRIFLNDCPETWFMSARPWSKAANASEQGNTLAGLHSNAILFLLDESGGIPESVSMAAEAALSSCEEGHIIQAGNPSDLSGMLYKSCTRDRNLWHVVEISSAPDDPKRTPRVSLTWVNEQIASLGRDNPWVLVNIYGQFPPASFNALIGVEEVEAAMKRSYRESEYSAHARILGCDVAAQGCFDDQTEILTDCGWKLFQNLSGKENVLSLNGNVAEWGKIEKIHRYPFSGEMNLYESQKVNFCVTDNHKMLIRTHQKSEKYKLEEYKNIPEHYMVRGWNEWKGKPIKEISFSTSITMPHGGTRTKRWNFTGMQWASFLGWFLSEGCVCIERRKAKRHKILIAQNPGKKMEKIKSLLTAMGIKWLQSGKFSVCFTSKSIGKHLLENCNHGAPNKVIPKYMKDASTEEIEAFLETFCLGDGSRKKNGNGRCYMTSSRVMADDIHEMLAKIGKAGCITRKQVAGSTFIIEGRKATRGYDMYCVYERPGQGWGGKRKNMHRDRHWKKSKAVKMPYNGYVWCVSTPNKIIYTRRHGKPMWSGNSDKSVIYPRQGLQMFNPMIYRNIDGTQGANIVSRKIQEWEVDATFIDASGGFGSSWIDNLVRLGFSPIGVHFSEKSSDPRFFNKRTEIIFSLVEWIKRGGAMPYSAEMIASLTESTYTHKGGALILEPKELLKAKLGYSPDEMDAAALTFAQPVMRASKFPQAATGRHRSDYAPLGMNYVKNYLAGRK